MKRCCKKCEQDIVAHEAIVICKGFCEGIQRYHTKCVGLSAVGQDTCHLRNVFWMCDECCDLMSSRNFRNTVNGWRCAERKVESEVECLRNEVRKLSESMNNFMDSAQTTNAIPASYSPILQSSGISPRNDRKKLASTGIFHESSLQQTDSSYASSSSGKIKLHLSNIAKDVTEAEVSKMIGEVLGLDTIPTIKCLVPSWMDSSSLEFVSFKVEIDSCFRSRALNPSCWPRGVRCREFKELTRNVWRPTSRSR